jgi:hypothetical protein
VVDHINPEAESKLVLFKLHPSETGKDPEIYDSSIVFEKGEFATSMVVRKVEDRVYVYVNVNDLYSHDGINMTEK